jgi:phage shock protein A
MAFFNRLSRWFRADLHALLDRMEEPGPLLRQALREMEEALAQSGAQLAALERELVAVQRRQESIAARVRASTEELELCFGAGQTQLLRPLMRRKLEAERLATQGMETTRRLESELEQRRAQHAAQQQQLAELRAQALLVDEEAVIATGVAGAVPMGEHLSVSETDVDLALLREQQRRTAATAAAGVP